MENIEIIEISDNGSHSKGLNINEPILIDHSSSNSQSPAQSNIIIPESLMMSNLTEKQQNQPENQEPSRISLIKVLKRVSVEKDVADLSPGKQQMYMELMGKRKKIDETTYVIPQSPILSTNERALQHKEIPLNTEEIEMAKVYMKRAEIKRQLKQNEKYYKKALVGEKMAVIKQNSPIHQEPIMLATTERLKKHQEYMLQKELRMKQAEEKRKAELKEKKRKELEKFKSPKSKISLTKPQPFDFISEKRARKPEENPEEFISLKEKVDLFYANRNTGQDAEKRSVSKGPTKPISPDFELKKRMASINTKKGIQKSSEELEIEEINKHPKFKATPVDERILYGNYPIGVPYIEPKPMTQFTEFELQTEQRAINTLNTSFRSAKSITEFCTNSVRLTHLNPEILAGPDFVPIYGIKPPTTPEPFNFQTEKRANSQSRMNSIDSVQTSEFKARPMPQYPAKPFAELPKHKPIDFEEFKLLTEERSKQRDEILTQKSIQNVESVSAFKARPMPDFSNPEPIQHEQKVTVPQEFNFATEQRIRWSENHLSSTQSECFRARPVPKFEHKSIEIHKSDKKPTKPEEIVLASEIRATKRAEFDKTHQEISAKIEAEKDQKRRENEEKEKQEIKEIRKQMAFKATKIMKGKPVEIKLGVIPVTIPQPPVLNTELRMKMRENKENIKTNEKVPIEKLNEKPIEKPNEKSCENKEKIIENQPKTDILTESLNLN